MMKTRSLACLAAAYALGAGLASAADQAAKVTEAVNIVERGSDKGGTSPAGTGTEIYVGQFLETGSKSRAELLLPTASVTRLGSNTIYNYSPATNTIDLQSGTVLFCKPKDAQQLNIKTAAVVAGIVGTTGFIGVQTDPKTHQKVYQFGIVEGHATARVNGQGFSLGAGDMLEFRAPRAPFLIAFDLPRFAKSSPLMTRFKSRLPNQPAINAAIARYQDDVSRGFIQPPSGALDYTADVPVLSTPAYDSAQNAQGRPGGTATPPPPPAGKGFSPSTH